MQVCPVGQSAAVLVQKTESPGPQAAAHSTEPDGAAPPSEGPASARPKPQHFGFAGSLQSEGAVQSTMILPEGQTEPHMVE
jgi:hypothetical protein